MYSPVMDIINFASVASSDENSRHYHGSHLLNHAIDLYFHDDLSMRRRMRKQSRTDSRGFARDL
jgi:N-acetylglutamate synthase-like GNAT family acetyltransferase